MCHPTRKRLTVSTSLMTAAPAGDRNCVATASREKKHNHSTTITLETRLGNSTGSPQSDALHSLGHSRANCTVAG
ncbi:hypothetical protein J6590_003850 [Homalodisca vitripennis]|nr:hypothetical protein J6590_003850 [Homalodisca vitripennis]